MKNNNYTSFFKTKPKKVERYIRCRKCGGNMEWSRDFPPQIKCTKCGYTVYPEPYEPDCIKLPETWEKYSELYEKARMKMSFMSEVIWEGYANTSSSEALKEQFNKFCNWCWGHSYGNCDICRREYHKLYIPLRIAEKQKELGLPVTRNKEDTKC